jgi:hypothetical protein
LYIVSGHPAFRERCESVAADGYRELALASNCTTSRDHVAAGLRSLSELGETQQPEVRSTGLGIRMVLVVRGCETLPRDTTRNRLREGESDG